MSIKTRTPVKFRVILQSGNEIRIEGDNYDLPGVMNNMPIEILDSVFVVFTKNGEVTGRFRMARVDGIIPIYE